MRSLPYQLVHLFPATFVLICLLHFQWMLAVPGLVFIVGIPLLDPLIGKDRGHTGEYNRSGDTLARLAPFVYTVLYLGSVAAALSYVRRFTSTLVFASCVLTVGICAGLAFSAVHELIHSRKSINHALANFCGTILCFGHFEIEHLYSHHRFAGTANDTSSARLGESLYRFLLRSIPHGVRFAWSWERRRLSRRFRQGPSLILRNRVFQTFVGSGLLIGAVTWLLGIRSGMFLIAQAVVGILLLMTAAYIQHYGIVRPEKSKLTPDHIWDSHYRLSNWINFGVQRHASHHLAPTKLYPRHVNYPIAPELPFGYPAMIAIALLPPVWMRLMNPRVSQSQQSVII
jgi:alkane 1-monooxygenase